MEGYSIVEDDRKCHCCGGSIEEERGGRYCMACAGKNGKYRSWKVTKEIVRKGKTQSKLF